MGDPKLTIKPAVLPKLPKVQQTPISTPPPEQQPTPAPSQGWAPKPAVSHTPASTHEATDEHGSAGSTLLHRGEQVAHGGKLVASVGDAAGKALAKAGKAKVLGALALPYVAASAVKDVRTAARTGSSNDINTAIGSSAYLSSVGSETLTLGLEVAERRAAVKLASTGAHVLAHAGGKTAGRLVPVLSAAIAASDVVWAGTVFRDPNASTAKKAAAGVSAATSVLAAAASHIPVLGTAGAAIASGISTGTLILSDFL